MKSIKPSPVRWLLAYLYYLGYFSIFISYILYVYVRLEIHACFWSLKMCSGRPHNEYPFANAKTNTRLDHTAGCMAAATSGPQQYLPNEPSSNRGLIAFTASLCQLISPSAFLALWYWTSPSLPPERNHESETEEDVPRLQPRLNARRSDAGKPLLGPSQPPGQRAQTLSSYAAASVSARSFTSRG